MASGTERGCLAFSANQERHVGHRIISVPLRFSQNTQPSSVRAKETDAETSHQDSPMRQLNYVAAERGLQVAQLLAV